MPAARLASRRAGVSPKTGKIALESTPGARAPGYGISPLRGCVPATERLLGLAPQVTACHRFAAAIWQPNDSWGASPRLRHVAASRLRSGTRSSPGAPAPGYGISPLRGFKSATERFLGLASHAIRLRRIAASRLRSGNRTTPGARAPGYGISPLRGFNPGTDFARLSDSDLII
jgi:hypothetical protein